MDTLCYRQTADRRDGALPCYDRGYRKDSDSVLNLSDPDTMSTVARLAEVGALLARGLLRGRVRAAGRREKDLDVLRPSSHSCPKPSSGGRRET